MPEAFTTRSLRELTRVVFSHLFGMILIVILLTGGTYVACKYADPIYESSVTVLVKQPKAPSSKVQEVSPDRSLEVFIKTQHQLIMSDRVLSRTMVLLEDSVLRRQWEAASREIPKAKPRNRGEARTELEKLIARVDEHADVLVKTRQRDLRKFRKKVEVETPGGTQVGMSEVFAITIRQPDRGDYGPGRQAKTAAALLASNYLVRYWEVQAESFKDAADLVQERLDQLRKDTLDKAQKELGTFLAEKLGGRAPEAQPTTQVANVLKPADIVVLEQLLKSGTEAGAQIVRRRFEEEQIELRTELAEAESLQRQIAEQLADERLTKVLTRKRVEELEARALSLYKPVSDVKADQQRQTDLKAIAEELFDMTDEPRIVVPQKVLTNNDIVNKMKKKLADLIILRNKMRGQFASTYRELIDLYVEIARAKLEIIEEMRAERNALDVQIKTIRARQDQVAEQIVRVTERLDVLAKLLPEYDRLQADLRVARQNYATMEAELLQAEADEQRAQKEVTIQVIDKATTPDPGRPVIPDTPVYTLVGLGVSLLLALAYAFLSDHFDHSLRSIQEVERYLGSAVLGSVSKSGRRIVV